MEWKGESSVPTAVGSWLPLLGLATQDGIGQMYKRGDMEQLFAWEA